MRYLTTWVAGIWLLATVSLLAQYRSAPHLSGVGLPFYTAEVFPTFSPDGKERLLRIYMEMLNDDITFVNQGDTLFVADLQIEVYVLDEHKNPIFDKTFQRHFETSQFENTASRDIKQSFFFEFPIKPGQYEAIISVVDKNTDKRVNRKFQFNVPSFRKYGFLSSNVLFLDTVERDSTGKVVAFTPNLTRNYAAEEDYIYFYFQTFRRPGKPLRIRYTVEDDQKRILLQNQYTLEGNGEQYQEHFLRLRRSQFDQNRYLLIVELDGNGKPFTMKRVFTFYWTHTPRSPKDLREAIAQLTYIFDSDSIKKVLKEPYPQQLEFFKAFWKSLDPNPQTEKNELMDEYYKRVNYANENFSNMGMEGWRTDRGRILIKFGFPDDIERHPFEAGTYPYEIWRYYDLRKVFLFIDRTGFGDYVLHPNYYDMEYN